MSVFTYKQRNILVLFALIFLGAIILYSLRDLFTAFLGAIILYVLCKPLYIYFKRRIGKVASAISIILISFVIIIIPFFSLSYMVVNRMAKFQKDQFVVKAMISRLDDFVGLKLNQPNLIDKYVSKLSLFVQDLFPSLLTGALGVFLTIAVMYFILYFMFVQSSAFERNLLKYTPLREHHSIQFAKELKNATYSNILGQGLISFVQGALVTFSFFIVGLDDAVFWGVIAFFLSFMPVIGAPVVTLPATLYLFLNGSTWQGTFMLLFTLVVIINIDNVIRFIINKKLADTHPIVTVIGVIIGLPLFGFVGLVFGPLLLVWFMHLINIYENDKAAEERLEARLENPQ
jgi:predicted PurR-regulated permease PerM